MTNELKEVHFSKYCADCKYEKNAELEAPCDECITESVNLYSHKPVRYEAKQ